MNDTEKDLALRLRAVASRHHCVGALEIERVHGKYGARSLEKRLHACGWVCPHGATVTVAGLRAMERAAGAPLSKIDPVTPKRRVTALECLQAKPGRWLCAKDVARETGATADDASKALRALVTAGMVEADESTSRSFGASYRLRVMEAAE
jgi:hypothetical protein